MPFFAIAFFRAPNGLTAPAPPPPAPPTPTPGVLSISGGSSTGEVGAASTAFVVNLDSGDFIGVLTPHISGGAGTVNPTTITGAGQTFIFTPGATGSYTISFTNDGGMTNPADLHYTSTAPAAIVLIGPNSGTIGLQTGDFTLSPPAGFTGNLNVISGNGGSFTQTTFTGAGPFTFRHTPSNPGVYNISITNTVGAINPTPISFTSNVAGSLSYDGTVHVGTTGNAIVIPFGITGYFGGVATFVSNLTANFAPISRTTAGNVTFTPLVPGLFSLTTTNTGGAANAMPFNITVTDPVADEDLQTEDGETLTTEDGDTLTTES